MATASSDVRKGRLAIGAGAGRGTLRQEGATQAACQQVRSSRASARRQDETIGEFALPGIVCIARNATGWAD